MVDVATPPASFPITGTRPRNIWDELDLLYLLNGTGIPERAALLNQLFNPVEAIGQSMQSSQEMFAPDRTGWERTASLGNMLSGVAGAVAPTVAAAKLGTPAANALTESLAGLPDTNMGRAAQQFYYDESGALRLMGGGMSDPTKTGWTFRDVRKPKLSTDDEARVQRMFDRVAWQEAELPIGRMIATQPNVNADFAETLSSQDLLPTVVQKGNELFVRDGHHRLVKAAESGNTKAKVALINLDQRTEAPLLDYVAPKPFNADDDALLAELMGSPPDPATERAQSILDMLKSGQGAKVTNEMLDLGDPVQNARLNEYLYRNYDLPMGEASRMARAREMGFDTGTPLFHGTESDFQSMRPSGKGAQGRGVYTTHSPSAAADYAGKWGGDASVLPLTARGQYTPNSMQDPYFRINEGDAGIEMDYGSRVDRVVQNPANIRSRFARFDPRLSHLSNLSAGLAGVGIGGAAIMPQDAQAGVANRNALSYNSNQSLEDMVLQNFQGGRR